ncbi:MAG: O-antigen ligase family protein [Anaerolineae bacterium]
MQTLTTNIRTGHNQSTLALFLLVIGAGLAVLPLRWAGVALAGSIAGCLILVRPRLGFYLLIPLIPFSSLFEFSLGGVSIGAMESLLGLTLVAWLMRMSARGRISFPHPPLLWPFMGFLGFIGLSWLVTFSAGASLKETLKWLEMLALYLFVVANVPRREIPLVIAVILLAGLAQATLGLYQFVFKAGPPGFLLFGGRFLRAFGTFRQPNPYGGYLGLVLPLALSLTIWRLDASRGDWGLGIGRFAWRSLSDSPDLQSPIPNTQYPIPNTQSLIPNFPIATRPFIAFIALLTPLGLLLAALFASQSRGAWLGFVVAASVTIAARSAKAALSLALMGLLGGILVSLGALELLPATLVQRFSAAFSVPLVGAEGLARLQVTNANFATVERLAHWLAAIEMWRDHLWLGVGFGNYAAIYPAYAIGRWLDPLGHAHNYLLNIGAEAGLLGLTGYLGFWLWVMALAWRAVRRSRQRGEGLHFALAAGILGVFAHLHTHNLFDNLYVQGMYLHIAIILGLLTLIDQPLTLPTKGIQLQCLMRWSQNTT